MQIKQNLKSVTAFAPATCANVAVGFDILGFSIDSVGDYVTLTLRDDNQIVIEKITSKDELPTDQKSNVSAVVIQKACAELNLQQGFSIYLQKGIALGSGMGGSAASAVAAIVAFNQFLKKPLNNTSLLKYALDGEEVACGARHADNVMPCLFGGLILTRSMDPLEFVRLPIPKLFYVVVHPHMRIDTKIARQVIKPELPLKEYVQQSANLAGFICALYANNFALLQSCLNDVLIEPRRSFLVPGFYAVKDAALKAGALGVSFSGSGSSIFALAKTKEQANKIGRVMQRAFENENIQSDLYINKLNNSAARIVAVDNMLGDVQLSS